MQYSILLVEDDPSVGYLLTEYLKMKGLNIHWVQNGLLALEALESQSFDLAIADIMMPGLDGFAFAEKIRNSGLQLPFIFLTARSMKVDVLKGFSLGAIDYLKKPIDEEELLVRIHAHLSRLTEDAPKRSPELMSIGAYRLDPVNQTLHIGDQSRSLTTREKDLLLYLAQHANQLCSHKTLLTQFWGKNDYFNRKSLNVFITKLRSYLAEDPNIRIDNVHNQGFVLRTGLK